MFKLIAVISFKWLHLFEKKREEIEPDSLEIQSNDSIQSLNQHSNQVSECVVVVNDKKIAQASNITTN